VKVVHKLLVVVFLPLAFEFIFVALLFLFQNEAAKAETTYQHSKAVVDTSGQIIRDVYDAAAASVLYSMTRSDGPLQRAKSGIARIHADAITLQDLTRENAQEKLHAEKIARMATEVADAADKIYEGSETYTNSDTWDPLLKTANLLVAANADLDAVEAPILQAGPRTAAYWRNWIQGFVIAGSAISLILTAVIIRFIGNDMVSRLGKMISNTTLVTERKTLPPVVSGDDEITKLDHFIHNMAARLAQTEESRHQLIRMVTHDLRAPLTNVRFLLGMISEGAFDSDPGKLKQRARGLEPEFGRLNRLVENLLDLEKLDSEVVVLNKQTLSSTEVAQSAIDSVLDLATASKINVILDAEQFALQADQDRILQVLVNLLSNAIEHSPTGGTVKVRSNVDSEHVEFSVTDEGVGLAGANAEQLFEPFTQGELKVDGAGYGLGLAIARQLVIAHGGQIGLRDNPNKGVTAWVKLPRNETSVSS
jgi:signal transduction histidine kinase